MELIFDTTKESDTTNTVAVKLGGIGPGGVIVDWGDGTTQSFTSAQTGAKTKNYATDGIKTVRIYGDLTRYGTGSQTNAAKLTQVTKFNGNTKSFDLAFYGCVNLVAVPAALPNAVTNMSYMFAYASAFNQNIGSWNTSAVTNMSGMFSDTHIFNQNIGSWNTAAVTDMSEMFAYASSFNQNLSSWVTGLTAQPDSFSIGANTTWVANKATRFPFLQGGTVRVNT